MRILVVSERYRPEITPASFRIAEHAARWLERGHEVTVLTSVPNHPRGVVFPGYRNLPFQVEDLDGVRLVRVWSYLAPAAGTIRRSLDYMSFTASAVAATPLLPPFDVALGTSPTLAAAAAARVIAGVRRRPWVFEVRDPWPASVRSLGALPAPGLLALERLERSLLRSAARVVCAYASIQADLVRRGVPRDKTAVVTNGSDLVRFDPARVRPVDRQAALGVPADAFLVGYAGTVGLAQGLEVVARAAALLRHDPRVWFVVLGEGARRVALEAEVARLGLERVVVRDFVARDLVPSYLAAFDVGLVHLAPLPVFRGTLPSKLFELMALGVPVLLGIAGEAAELVGGAGCGVCFPSGDPQAMATAIVELVDDPERRRVMSAAGRQLGREFDRAGLADRLLVLLEEVAGADAALTRS
ncbi:MAG: glycosyltransferase family 4 protein [Planctomycetes bacterium]|nr:glycosyltransferase family 4 protein [Planctomycetota bacterium]